MPKAKPFEIVPGMVLGRLRALELLPGKPYKWRCQCSCGNVRDIHQCNLFKDSCRSCGCLRKERTSLACTTHGESGWHGKKRSPEYSTWAGMLTRCHNPNSDSFADYGAKGIKVCDRWHTFENFLADMERRPSLHHSLDRIDNSRGYEPGNLRWAVATVQSRNRTNNRLLTLGNQTLTMSEWAERYGLSVTCIYKRLKRGWPVEKALGVSS